MNFLKRALHGVLYYKKNSLLLFLIFAILSTLILSGFCIRAASQETSRRIGIEIGGSVEVKGRKEAESPAEACVLSRESADRIAGLEQVSESLYTNTALACADSFRPKEDEAGDTPPSEYDLTVRGSNGVHPDLQAHYRLLEGRRIQPGDRNVAMVHEWLIKERNVKVGDTITVASAEENGTKVDLTVIGVFMSDQTLFHFNERYTYVENRIYTDLAPAQTLTGSTALESAQYTVEDPSTVPALMAGIGKLELPEREQLAVAAHDGEYRKIAVSLNSLSNIATLLFTASILLGAVILTALVMMSLGDRQFEIGVLLSMGENRAKVVLQLVLESLVPILLAVTAGVFLSMWASGFLGSLLGAERQGIQVVLEPFPVLLMYLCGLGLTLLASCVTAYKVLTYRPKKMLMAME